VLCFLSVEDMVRFDSALATKIYRLLVEATFARCTVDLRDNDQANRRRNIWRWCTERLVNIKKLQFSALDSEDIPMLEKMLQHCVSVDGTVHWHYSSAAAENGSMASILNNNIIRTKITCISWSDDATSHLPPATPPVWSKLKCLKRLHMYGAKHTEQALSSILLANNMLQDVTLRHFAIGSSTTVAALCSRSASLLKLSLFFVQCCLDLLVAVGKCCCNLRHLSIYILGKAAAKAWVTEAGLLAVAAGCRKLQQLTLSNIPAVSEAVLLAVAAHCPAMEWLYSAGYGTLTDAVLLALAVGCSKLRQLTCHAWAVTSVDAVDAAQSLLSRLKTCPIDCTPDASPAAVARAAELLRNLTHLSLRYLSAEHIADLSERWKGYRSLANQARRWRLTNSY
jgi:hypothetical protein